MKDPKYLSIPNIQFSLASKDDEREQKFKEQRIQRGFDDSETWSLTDTICNFILPRLERFIELDSESTERSEEFNRKVAEFKESLHLIARDEGMRDWTEDEEQKIDKGLENFKSIFLQLWW